jgi:hypothetical protein
MYDDEIYLPNPDFDISDNLIYRWQEYGSMTQDSYPEYHIASMMVLISHVIRAEIILAHGPIRNNMWCIILGKSGSSGKSSAVKELRGATYSEKLKGYVIYLTSKTTAPAMFLSFKEKQNRLHYYDECVGFLKVLEKDYNGDLPTDYITAYDGDTLSERVIGRSRETSKEDFVRNPRLSTIWATTLDSFSKHADRDQFASGFFLRPFFIIQKRDKPVMEDIEATQEMLDFKEGIILKLANLCHLIGNKKVRFSKCAYIAKWKLNLRSVRNDRPDIENSAMTRIYDLAYKAAMNLTLASKEFYEYMEAESKSEGNLVDIADISYQIPDDIAKFACELAEQYFFRTTMMAYHLTTDKGDYETILKEFNEGRCLSVTQIGTLIKKSGRRSREIITDLMEDYDIEAFKIRVPGAKKYTTLYGFKK